MIQSNNIVSTINDTQDKNVIDANVSVALAQNVGACLRKDCNVENLILSDHVNYLAYERMLGLMEKPKLLVRIGQALPLMTSFIRRCADQNSCNVMYPALMEELGVSSGTIKNWSRYLEKIGLITKSVHSVKGITVTLSANILSKPTFLTKIESKVQKNTDILLAVKTTMECAISSAIHDMKQN